MLEAAVPTIAFTVLWLTTRDLRLALVVSIGVRAGAAGRPAGAALDGPVRGQRAGRHRHRLAVRHVSASRGGSADDQALAYFLPGILYNSGYSVADGVHLPDRLAAGRLHGRQRHRRPDRLARGQAGREALHPADLAAGPARAAPRGRPGPIWLAGHSGAIDADTAVAALGVLKIALGWPLQLAALGAMLWLLSRNSTPVVSRQPPLCR